MADNLKEQNNTLVTSSHRKYLIAYNVFLAIFLPTALAALIAFTPSMPANSELKGAADNSTYRLVVITTLVAMFVAGAADTADFLISFSRTFPSILLNNFT